MHESVSRWDKVFRVLNAALNRTAVKVGLGAFVLSNTLLLFVLVLTEHLCWLPILWPLAVTHTLFCALLITSVGCLAVLGAACIGWTYYQVRREVASRTDAMTFVRRAFVIPTTYVLSALWSWARLSGRSDRSLGAALVGLFLGQSVTLFVFYAAKGFQDAQARTKIGEGGGEGVPPAPVTPARVRPSLRFALWRRWWELTHPNHFRRLPPLNRALAKAAVDGTAHNVEVFLKRGADPNLRLMYGGPLVTLSASCGRAEVVRLLVDAGADVNAAAPSTGFNPLLIAAKDGDLELTRLLVERGADLEARIRSGATPLMLAALHGHVEVTQFLLERGARVNAAANKGATALILAAGRGHTESVRALLDAGAHSAMKTVKGRTALDSARQNGHREAVALLEAAGGVVTKGKGGQ